MLHLLLGKDYFAKQDYIEQLARERKLGVVRKTPASLEDLLSLGAPSLFATPEIIVIERVFDLADPYEALKRLNESGDIFVVVEEKIDKRKTANAELLKFSGIVVKEFSMPRQPADLIDWVLQHASQQSIVIEKLAAQELVSRLGYGSVSFDAPEPEAWLFHNELQKLATYTKSKNITSAVVQSLILNQDVPKVWDIIDAMGQRQQTRVVNLLQGYLEANTEVDEKAKVIQLSALLAEQFRNLLLVKSAGEQGVPDQDILQKTGWKSGRLFVMRKNTSNFTIKNLTDILAKFEALDLELKSSSTPPRVLIDLISSQI